MRPRLAPALTLALAVTFGGCGGEEQADGDAVTTSTSPSTTSTTVPTEAPSSSTVTTEAPTTATTATPDALDPADPTLEGEGIGDIEEFAPDLLLVAGDLGVSFIDAGYLPGPGPCGADVDAMVPVDVLVGTDLESAAPGAAVRQELRVYAVDPIRTATVAVEKVLLTSAALGGDG